MTETFVEPTREQWETFVDLPRDEPVQLLNLVRFYKFAKYPEGHPKADSGLTGAQAYQSYGVLNAPLFNRIGGSVVWIGRYESTMVGPSDEKWDEMFITQYPTSSAFLAMISDPLYQKAAVHRKAAIETARLIRCAPSQIGATFG